jgi:hypothetical protein
MEQEYALLGIRIHLQAEDGDGECCEDGQESRYSVFLHDRHDPTKRFQLGAMQHRCCYGYGQRWKSFSAIQPLPAEARIGPLHFLPLPQYAACVFKIDSSFSEFGGLFALIDGQLLLGHTEITPIYDYEEWPGGQDDPAFCFNRKCMRPTGHLPKHRPVWILYGQQTGKQPDRLLDPWCTWFKNADEATHQCSDVVRKLEQILVNFVDSADQLVPYSRYCQTGFDEGDNVFFAYAALHAIVERLATDYTLNSQYFTWGEAGLPQDKRNVILVRFQTIVGPTHSAVYVVRGASGLGKSFLTGYLARGNPTLRVLETDDVPIDQPLPDLATFSIVVMGRKHARQVLC